MKYNITELKKHLGIGLGNRKNRYLIEIPVPTISGDTLNILCRSASFPERNISTTDIWHKGRRYTVRGETDYVGEYEVTFVDNDEMSIRKMFDEWVQQVDNTSSNLNKVFDLTANILDIDKLAMSIGYQIDINIWQLDANNQKVYGYAMQNAFPKSVSSISLEDSDENSLSEFNVVFAFSEFTPLENTSRDTITSVIDI